METEPTEILTWMTVQEMQRTLRIGKNTALALLASGAVDGIRVGRAVRVSRVSLDRFIAANPYVSDDGEGSKGPSPGERP
jgi:excisionase family DNA binding protein